MVPRLLDVPLILFTVYCVVFSYVGCSALSLVQNKVINKSRNSIMNLRSCCISAETVSHKPVMKLLQNNFSNTIAGRETIKMPGQTPMVPWKVKYE